MLPSATSAARRKESGGGNFRFSVRRASMFSDMVATVCWLRAETEVGRSRRGGRVEVQQANEQIVKRAVLARREGAAGEKVRSRCEEDAHHLRRHRIVAVLAKRVHCLGC